MYDWQENIKFRTEINRELLNSEVDDNFRYVSNPWSSERTYRKGMVVYYETDIVNPVTTSGYEHGTFWFIANTETTKGLFIDSEWEIFGAGIPTSTHGLVTNAFSGVLINGTTGGTFSITPNVLFNAVHEDTFEIQKGLGIKLEHDITKKIVKISTELSPVLDGTTHILTLGNETVNLTSLISGYWTDDGLGTMYTTTLTNSIGIGTISPTSKLDIDGTLRVRSILAGTTNDVLIKDSSGNIKYRSINPSVWNTSASYLQGTGTLNYLPIWTSSTELGDSILYQTSGKLGISTILPTEMLHVSGAICIGSVTNNTNGSIRYTGTDFEGKLSTGWVSLTSATMDKEQVEDWVGDMVGIGSTQTGIIVSYDDPAGKLHFAVDSFTLNLTGQVTGSVSIDWSAASFDIVTTLGALSITLGTDTTGDYVESLTEGNGISITGGTGVGSTPVIGVDVDGVTITNVGGTGTQLAVLKVPYSHTISPGNGISITNYATTFNGSANVTHTFSILADSTGGANISTCISVGSNGIGVYIDDSTIVTNLSNQLEVGTLGNANLQYSSITINGITIDLGGSGDISMEDIFDVSYPVAPTTGQVLKYTATNIWEPADESVITVPGNAGDILYSDGAGNLDSSSNINFDSLTNTLTIDADTYSHSVYIEEGYFTHSGDLRTVYLPMQARTTDSTTTEMFIDGISEELYVPLNSIMSFRIKITAMRVGGTAPGGTVGDAWVHEYLGAVKNISGTTSMVGTVFTDIEIAEDTSTSAWTITISPDTVNDKLKVEVQGEVDVTINWGAIAEITIIKQ